MHRSAAGGTFPATASVCVPSPQRSERSEAVLGESGPVCVPSYSPPDKHGKQDPESSVSEVDHNSSRLAQHALILGSGGIVIPDTVMPTKPSGYLGPAVQWQPEQGSA